MTDIPRYHELPIDGGLPPRSSWRVFGERDELGAMNLLTAERTLAAASLIRRGDVFSLNWGLEQPDPPILGRRPLVHTVLDGPSGADDRYDAFFPQASSQWDALTHVRHPEYGYYNGWSRDEVSGVGQDPHLGIDGWARRGLAGRFVVADVAGHFARRGTPIDPAQSVPISVEDLEETLEAQGVGLTPGTFLLVDVGWMAWYADASPEVRARLAEGADFSTVEHDLENFFPSPGLSRDESMAEWLWNSGVVAVASDAPAVEAMPMHRGTAEGFLHYRLVALLGIAIGEMWDLRALTDDCRRDGVYEGFLTSAPLNKSGGTGSPANALAIK